MMLLPIERRILAAAVLVLFGSCLNLWLRNATFAVSAIAVRMACGVVLVLLGIYYRRYRREANMALALIAIGLFIIVSLTGAITNYVFVPVAFPPIDPLLIRIDAMIGYDWVSVVSFAATHPWIGWLLFVVYSSSLLQLVFLTCWHGFRGDQVTLYHLMLTGMIALVASMTFWVFFPSFGALSYGTLPAWVEQAIPVASSGRYGAELLRLAVEGPSEIDPAKMVGLIAFPSFHSVMACMAVVFAPRPLPLRLGFYAVNLLMVPAVLVQGGHHLVDIFGGIAFFLFAWWVAGAIMRRAGDRRGQPVPLAATTAP